jgi:chemotaxis protein CheC
MKYDILKELFNISVGKAADILSEIVSKKILLNVPQIDYLNNQCKVTIQDCIPEQISGALMVSSIAFKDKIDGKANLIFSASKMKKFVKLCMHEDENDIDSQDFTDIDFDIIKEIGNIILNCILGETGNYLEMNFNYSLPEVKIFDRIDLNQDIQERGYSHMLVLHITFIIDDTEIEGAIIIDLTVNSINMLNNKIGLIEANLDE